MCNTNSYFIASLHYSGMNLLSHIENHQTAFFLVFGSLVLFTIVVYIW